MACLSYGFETPEDLFEKLKREGAKLKPQPDRDDVFNFLVTAASLNEWIAKVFKRNPTVVDIATSLRPGGTWEQLPELTIGWIADLRAVPNEHCDVRRHIHNCLRICWDVAGASKHFYWSGTRVKEINSEPIVKDLYQYFFTSVEPDLYVDIEGEAYGLSQIRGIVVQFYAGLISHVRGEQSAT